MISKKIVVLRIILLVLFSIFIFSCTGHSSSESSVQVIKNMDHLKQVIDSTKDKIVLFDLYADWCGPCRMLAPVLEEIAKEKKEEALVYKIDTEKHPQIAAAFGVTGIPYVSFFKNGKPVHVLTGFRNKETYLRVIDFFSEKKENTTENKASGSIENGIRIIKVKASALLDDLYVYRGDTVKITVTDVKYPISLLIPEYDVSGEGKPGSDFSIQFKAKKEGVFSIICNGNCPQDNGENLGKVVVMPYKGSQGASFQELTAREAKEYIGQNKPIILDVRTPYEYHSGHLENAILLPVQQLEERIEELEKYKNKAILVYCRSGNRSTVAAKILIDNGFSTVYNLRPGIRGWLGAGYDIKNN